MASPDILVKTFDDYTPTVIDDGNEVPNSYYPDYTYWAHDNKGSLVVPNTIVIHSMCVPAENSLSGYESTDPYECKNLLESLGVSTHYIVPENEVEEDKDGTKRYVVYQMTQDDRKAWHAGASRLPNLQTGEEPVGLNHTGLGIELTRRHGEEFTDEQYLALTGLVVQLIGKGYPIENILGHNEVAGDDVRGEGNGKTDPEKFDWDRFMGLLAGAQGATLAEVAHYRARVA